MDTIRLFYRDPYLRSFSARVGSCETADGGRWHVVLDQTAFYPTSGGQPNDLGTLGGVRVLDVIEHADTIVHVTDGPVPEVATEGLAKGLIEGALDWNRRHDHMQQHTGQHLLSGAFAVVGGLETIGFHLGEEMTTIDLAAPTLTPDLIREVESLAEGIIAENRSVSACWYAPAEAAALPLRKTPAVEGDVRVVEIKGFDWSPCGGTHLLSTGEIRLLKVKSWERYKGNVRVYFLAGARALKDYADLHQVTDNLSRAFAVGVADLEAAACRSRDEAANLRKELLAARDKLVMYEADSLLKESRNLSGFRVVREVFTGRTLDELRLLAAKIAAHPSSVALLGLKSAVPQLVFSRSADLRLDIGQIMKGVLPAIDGKGGGSPASAQGGGSKPEGLGMALDLALARVCETLNSK